MTQSATDRYLSLLKKCVLEEPYLENEVRLIYLRHCLEGLDTFDAPVLLDIARGRPELYRAHLAAQVDGSPAGRWPEDIGFYHSMIGRRRLDNVHSCLDAIRREGTPGDLLECGVWRGGTVVFMRGYLAVHDLPDRNVWVADSFAGLPKPTGVDEGLDLSQEVIPILAVERRRVEQLFRAYELLDPRVRFLEGWFADTLPQADFSQLALLRLDGDLYSSTRDALVACYDRVTSGGFVIVDDYGAIPQCARAVTDFRAERGITEAIQTIDWTGVYWQKS
jgi:O-methyltransferase